jgi:transcription elongation factor Elf1
MTRANALGGGGSVTENRTLRERRKSILVCPTCDHESPVDGDWIVTVREDRCDLSCPECRTRLTTRWLRE